MTQLHGDKLDSSKQTDIDLSHLPRDKSGSRVKGDEPGDAYAVQGGGERLRRVSVGP